MAFLTPICQKFRVFFLPKNNFQNSIENNQKNIKVIDILQRKRSNSSSSSLILKTLGSRKLNKEIVLHFYELRYYCKVLSKLYKEIALMPLRLKLILNENSVILEFLDTIEHMTFYSFLITEKSKFNFISMILLINSIVDKIRDKLNLIDESNTLNCKNDISQFIFIINVLLAIKYVVLKLSLFPKYKANPRNQIMYFSFQNLANKHFLNEIKSNEVYLLHLICLLNYNFISLKSKENIIIGISNFNLKQIMMTSFIESKQKKKEKLIKFFNSILIKFKTHFYDNENFPNVICRICEKQVSADKMQKHTELCIQIQEMHKIISKEDENLLNLSNEITNHISKYNLNRKNEEKIRNTSILNKFKYFKLKLEYIKNQIMDNPIFETNELGESSNKNSHDSFKLLKKSPRNSLSFLLDRKIIIDKLKEPIPIAQKIEEMDSFPYPNQLFSPTCSEKVNEQIEENPFFYQKRRKQIYTLKEYFKKVFQNCPPENLIIEDPNDKLILIKAKSEIVNNEKSPKITISNEILNANSQKQELSKTELKSGQESNKNSRKSLKLNIKSLKINLKPCYDVEEEEKYPEFKDNLQMNQRKIYPISYKKNERKSPLIKGFLSEEEMNILIAVREISRKAYYLGIGQKHESVIDAKNLLSLNESLHLKNEDVHYFKTKILKRQNSNSIYGLNPMCGREQGCNFFLIEKHIQKLKKLLEHKVKVLQDLIDFENKMITNEIISPTRALSSRPPKIQISPFNERKFLSPNIIITKNRRASLFGIEKNEKSDQIHKLSVFEDINKKERKKSQIHFDRHLNKTLINFKKEEIKKNIGSTPDIRMQKSHSIEESSIHKFSPKLFIDATSKILNSLNYENRLGTPKINKSFDSSIGNHSSIEEDLNAKKYISKSLEAEQVEFDQDFPNIPHDLFFNYSLDDEILHFAPEIDERLNKSCTLDYIYDISKYQYSEIPKSKSMVFTNSELGIYNESSITQPRQIKIEDFQFIKFLSKGGYGSVCLVKKKNSGDIYALKIVSKKTTIEKNQVEFVQTEKRILTSVHNDYIVQGFYTFQNESYLYFVMEYMIGGDLGSLLKYAGYFEEEHAKFYIAEIALALGYLHSKNIIHRDIKPGNILIDSRGHCKLTDFGLSEFGLSSHKKMSGEIDIKLISLSEKPNPLIPKLQRTPSRRILPRNAYVIKGSPDYLAPEILKGEQTTLAVDWWALGILSYELFQGSPPFTDFSHEKIWENILNKKIEYPIIGKEEGQVSKECVDFLEKLLELDPLKRLGSKGIEEIKNHPFFLNFQWDDILNLTPPFVPQPKSPDDTSYFAFQPDDPDILHKLTPAMESEWEKLEHFKDFSSENYLALQALSNKEATDILKLE